MAYKRPQQGIIASIVMINSTVSLCGLVVTFGTAKTELVSFIQIVKALLLSIK